MDYGFSSTVLQIQHFYGDGVCVNVVFPLSDVYSSVKYVDFLLIYFYLFNKFKPNEMSHSYHLEQSISAFKVCWVLFFIFIQFCK